MVSVDHVVALVKAHYERDEQKFTHALQMVSAREARAGHKQSARRLDWLLDHYRPIEVTLLDAGGKYATNPQPDVSLDQLVVSEKIKHQIRRVLSEWEGREKLQNYGLSPRRKLLLEGPPGTGKTMTAMVIATELGLPLHTLQTHQIITKYLGETSARLHDAFDTMLRHPGVFLLDEFDSLATNRDTAGEVGEMRRIVNTLLQLLDRDTSNRIIIAATNNHGLLDPAVYRRFDDTIHYQPPTPNEAMLIAEQTIRSFFPGFRAYTDTAETLSSLSQAEIVKTCLDTVKQAILADTTPTNQTLTAAARTTVTPRQ